MFTVQLTSYGQTLVSSLVNIDGIILLYDTVADISSVTSVSSYTVQLDEEACGNLNKNVGNVKVQDSRSDEYIAKTILFYVLNGSEKKIVAGYSQDAPIIQKGGSPLTVFLSFDFSAFTNGFLFSSIQAGYGNAAHNTDGIVHIENPEISTDDTFSVYNKVQVDALLSNKQSSLEAGDGISLSDNIVRTTGIPFGICDSTSTATVFTVNVPGIYKLEDGVCCLVKNGVVTSASGFTLNVNNLGAKPVYSNMAAATRDTTIFNVAYTMLFVYDSTRVADGCWICYRGYYSDSNSLAYQIRGNVHTLPTTEKFYRYRLLFTSADGTHFVPSNTSTSTNATALRNVNQTPIDPFGEIVYYSTTTAVEENTNPGPTYLWTQYAIAFGYSFNRSGATLTLTSFAPVYIKCEPQSNGSAIIDADTPYVQSLPNNADGNIYIFLGVANNATSVELLNNHPVYYHDGTAIRLWHGKDSYTKDEIDSIVSNYVQSSLTINNKSLTSDITLTLDDISDGNNRAIPTNVSQLNNDAGYLTSYTESDPTVPNWAKQPTKPTYTAAEVGALPDTTVIPTVHNATLTIKKNNSDTGDTFTANASQNKTINLELANVATTGSYNDLTNKPSIPTDTSDLTNNAGFITSADVPTKVSELTNDSGYIITETDPTVPAWAKNQNKPTYNLDEVTDGSTRKLPTKTSQLTNDSNFLTSHQSIKTINNQSLIGTGNVTIATGENNVIESISVNNTAQTVTNKNVNITVPTKTSDLTNDSGFITSASVPSDISAFNNDAGYITTETDPTVPNWAKQANKPSYNLDEVTDGSTRKLSNYVPTSRKVNNKALSSDITLNLDDVLDGSTRKLNSYVPYSEIISTINGFDNRRLWQYEIHNTLWAANKRYDVTLTGFSNNNAAASLFDGSFETNVVVPKSGTGVILISGKNNTKMWSGGYPYGYLEVAFYYTSIPESVTCRVYSDWAQNPGWHSITLTNVCKNSNQALYRGVNTGFYGVTQMEITINAKDTVTANVTEVAFYQTRGTLQQMSVFNKTVAQTLYHDLTGTKFIVSGGTSSQFLKADGSLDSNTYITSASIPTNVSSFTNDAGYITSSALTPYELKTNLKEGAYINVDESTMTSTSANLPTGKAVASYISGLNYITSTDIPTNVSAFTNDAGYLTSHQSLAGVVATAQYNSTSKKIEFYNPSGTKLSTDIDASAFVKDGMIDTVEISNGKLVISFNTDAGKEDIEIPISDIFNASNYYTKSETNTQINSAITDLNLGTASTKNYSTDMNTDANLPTTAAIKSYITNKNFATVSQIPTTTSQLTNNSGFITSADIPTNVSAFTNDSGYITSAALTPYELKSNLKEGAYVNVDETTMTSSSTNLPTSKAVASYISNQGFAKTSQIPDSTSDLTNDSGFITSADIPANVSSFTNDAGYLVSSDLPTNHVTTDTAQEITGTKTIAESKLKIGNTSSSEDIDNFVFKRGQEFIVGTQTSSTSLWKGNTIQDSIYEGMCVNYFVPVACTSTAITLELTLPDGTTTGAIPVRRNAGSTATSTHIGVGSVVQLTLLLNRTVGSTSYEKVWRMNEWYDSNTNTTGYQLRTNSTVMNVSDTARYYKLYFTSANGNLWVPASVNSTNDATTARAVNQRPINPFGRIVYTSASTNYATGANLAATTIWDQYNLSLGYSFNVNGGTLTLTAEKPVYVKCSPQADGSAIIDATNPTVQDLPTSNDGKIYIFLGTATSATAVELFQNHPVYYHDGNGIKLWSGVVLPSKTSDLTNDSGFITSSNIPTNVSAFSNDAGYLTSYTETDPTVPSWAKASTKPSYTLDEVSDGSTRKLSNYELKSNLKEGAYTNVDETTMTSSSTNLPTGKAVASYISGLGYITTESDPTVPSWAKQSSKPSYTLDEVSDGSTRKLSNYVPTSRKVNNKALSNDVTLTLDDIADGTTRSIPKVNNSTITIKKNSSDTGDSFTTNAASGKTINLGLATVATSGSYNDLSNKPTIPTVNDTTITIKKNTSDAGDSFTTNTATAKTINLGLSTVATSGSYNDLSNKPTIPTVNNASLTINKGGTDDTGSKTFTANASSNVTINLGLSTVASSGSYNDLSNKPTIPTVNNSTITIKKNSDDTGDSFTTNASSGKTINLGLATVATSGSYNDLSNKPTIPTVNNATLTIQKNGTTVKTFTANASSNVTANITVPIESISVDGTTQTITNKNVDLHIPDDISAIETIGSFYRNNVNGSGNITLTSTLCQGQFPTISVAGTYKVRVRMYSSTASYSLSVRHGSNTYTLTSSNGVIDDTRTLTLAAGDTWSGALTSAVNANTVIRVHIYKTGVTVNTVGITAVSNDYNDLDNIPTIPTATSQLTNNSGFITSSSLSSYVPTTRTINSKALSSNITLTLDDVADGSTRKLSNYVTTDTAQTITGLKTINKALLISGTNSDNDRGIIRPENNLGVTLGAGTYRFNKCYVDTICLSPDSGTTSVNFNEIVSTSSSLIISTSIPATLYGTYRTVLSSDGINFELASTPTGATYSSLAKFNNTAITAYKNIIPSSSSVQLGTSSDHFNNAYIDNLYVNNGTALSTYIAGITVTNATNATYSKYLTYYPSSGTSTNLIYAASTTSVLPSGSSGTIDLGSDSSKFNAIYANSFEGLASLASESFMLSTINAYLSTPVRKEVVGVQATSSVIYNLIPAIKLSENSVTTNLGSSSYKWDRLYCTYIGDGSNKITTVYATNVGNSSNHVSTSYINNLYVGSSGTSLSSYIRNEIATAISTTSSIGAIRLFCIEFSPDQTVANFIAAGTTFTSSGIKDSGNLTHTPKFATFASSTLVINSQVNASMMRCFDHTETIYGTWKLLNRVYVFNKGGHANCIPFLAVRIA